ncbi:FAD-dependent oxidoreductase [Hydrogenophaga sp.]|uniref:FAD-dependent oxidoreductase n=1 Tax=Hydrogenophaga sp. TaxID=1904254 RepID=UPI0025C0F4AC|nr:FAD-dependent oxidoreductase [Hydrogenophaga sp.]
MSESADRHALVIGAGLAGAALCAALTRRGWRITLLEAAAGPAQAASALPVGMLSPHLTRAPTPLSRLCELGLADARAELEQLLAPGQGWQPCEVDNLGHASGRWPAALVRPAALVAAWLAQASAHPSFKARWQTRVARLLPPGGAPDAQTRGWRALDANGCVVAQAPVAVVTAAFGSLALLGDSLPGLTAAALPLRPVKGQLSLAALRGPALAPRPQRNNGVFVPCYQDSGLAPAWPTRIWAMGSTYRRGDASCTIESEDHERNALSLAAIDAAAALGLRDAAASGELLGWAQVRCASLDRLPLVGALPDLSALQALMEQAGARRGRLTLEQTPRWPGLFVLAALGSRGLTLAHWCAERLAARIDAEAPCALDPDLLRALDPARFAWRLARQQPRPAGA